MAFSDLQLGLVCAGGAAVVAVVGYNLWQERRARKHAEQLFRPGERDALLDGEDIAAIPPAPGGRMEPTSFGSANPFDTPESHEDLDIPAPAPSSRARTSSARASQPGLPVDSQAIDCVVTVEAPAGIAAASLFTAQQALLAGFSKPLRWFGWDDGANQWVELDARSPGNLNRATAALQLADRRGAVSDADLVRFYDQVQRLCDQFLAVPRLPARNEVLERANELDRFCADVDIQIAVNVAAKDGSFPGTKIRGLAEAAGLTLHADGAYHAQDDNGRTLFTLSNQEAATFSAEQLRNLYTTGVTVALDVPRAPDPVASFDKMVAFAQKLAASLNGVLVDDNRVLLSERSISLIRGQIAQFDQQMERQGIPAGGEVALRLFR
ncbi:cell division protein ZipA C-terminal FtsZ-binding domain-containing protein [Uliginosibacterium sp. H3]|uniref:Cell division protein ZipA n=1 Tax=Uliginosibacterium silvisoli TaxID=3114758 RepID=A0ABU6K8I9_9RHOO|nr:cell division protein ZipA C-terminal FtsZ-binding domain-containing protein [Uliginosibacterium sp. H3]